MADSQHLKLISLGSHDWNEWRKHNRSVRPDLSGADLSAEDLSQSDLSYANLQDADLSHSDLNSANLQDADLTKAELSHGYLYDANLSRAKLCNATLINTELLGANLVNADLSYADLSGADLSDVDLSQANLSQAEFTEAILIRTSVIGATFAGADFSRATIGAIIFADSNLSTVKGLESVRHVGPSTIGIDTLFRSDGKIPAHFLKEAGVPESFFSAIPSLVGRAIDFYSCFLSYSHKDQEFARRVQSRLRRENLRVWFAPEDLKGGRKVQDEIFRAIQIHDKLLLVLSENSMKSEWVMTEIRRARKVEREENRRKLFPIRLVDFEAIQKWECFDADTGKDLGVELREYYIPDFSNWKDHDAFEVEFGKLLRDLRATEG